MSEIVGKRWWAYSKRSPDFEIMGYTTPGGDFHEDATKAMEILSKHLKEPIPSDVELCLLADEQEEIELYEQESYSG